MFNVEIIMIVIIIIVYRFVECHMPRLQRHWRWIDNSVSYNLVQSCTGQYLQVSCSRSQVWQKRMNGNALDHQKGTIKTANNKYFSNTYST